MDISIDSRTLKPGQWFIPIKGPNFDGRAFIPDVIAKGGRVLDVDLTQYAKSYRKKLKCQVIGITGSAGKTTAKDMLYAILSQKFSVVKTEENQNNEIGVPLTLLKADADTDILIVEMGMCHRGDIKTLAQIVRPSVSIITKIGVTHLELMKTQRNIAYGKAEIFQKPLAWETQPRYAFVNSATPYYDVLSKKAQDASYTLLPFSGEDPLAQALDMCQRVGRHFGLSADEINTGLANFETSSHRLKHLQSEKALIIDDCYNANPDGVGYALTALSKQKGRKIFVFGDMFELGDKAAYYHQEVVGQAINAGVEMMFLLGDETKKMQSDTLPLFHFDSVEELLSHLILEIKQGDVILVKGSRGMKMERVVEKII